MSKFVSSMTGFARKEGGDETLRWAWEIKSVNGKSLDVRCRLPNGFEALEPKVRAAAGRFARGNLQVGLAITGAERPAAFRVNEELLENLLALAGSLKDRKEAAPPRLDGLLSVRGVIEAVEEEEEEAAVAARQASMLADFEAALAALAEMRSVEGARLRDLAVGHLDTISDLVAQAENLAAAQPEALRERLRKQVEELLQASPALPEERLAQEAAVLATKADVREELDRLASHVEAARELIAGGGAVGRRLDFLCQEFNREANTLCAKSSDVALTRIGLELKTVVDQLREQIQNIE